MLKLIRDNLKLISQTTNWTVPISPHAIKLLRTLGIEHLRDHDLTV
jgi:hypothetical protein